MANARLVSIELERFKSYRDPTRFELAPLTVLLGRNNSGKSTLIQALLLLKQTLAQPRTDVPLHLEGLVDAISLRELTYGWPETGPEVPGPRLKLQWESGLMSRNRTTNVTTELELEYAEFRGQIVLKRITLSSLEDLSLEKHQKFTITHQDDGQYKCAWNHGPTDNITIKLIYFLPYLFTNPQRDKAVLEPQKRATHIFSMRFAEALEDLKGLLEKFVYLGPARTGPFPLYRPTTVPPAEIGVSGEYAAQMLRARRRDVVHYLPPLWLKDDDLSMPSEIRSRSLLEGTNDILRELGVDANLEIEDVGNIGFRLFLGQATLQHVGRGISHLLPVIQLGLLSDPLRFQFHAHDIPIELYKNACPGYTNCALEEPEAHLHPKLQTRLAHWFVALAMAQRQITVETHSDHLVRRLRGLAARAKPGSELEQWLLENVSILHVEQTEGQSQIRKVQLTPKGGLEEWPADFMDEATKEERAIYHAALDKSEEEDQLPRGNFTVEHDVGEEPEP